MLKSSYSSSKPTPPISVERFDELEFAWTITATREKKGENEFPDHIPIAMAPDVSGLARIAAPFRNNNKLTSRFL